MGLHVKKGDMVEIITGDHKGATGRILRVLKDKGKVIVQGHNIAKKHVRQSQKNPQGGRISVEQPIHISNVLVVNPKTSKGSRISFKIDKKGKKTRVAQDGTEINVVTKAKK